MIGVREGGANSTIANIGIREGGANTNIAKASILVGGVDYVVFDSATAASLTVTQSPFSAVGSGGSAADIPVTTNEVTATASGGTAPYTYAWTKVSGAAEWSILSPSSAATRFRHSAVAEGLEQEAVFRCTATDARGRTGTVDAQAYVFNFGSFR